MEKSNIIVAGVPGEGEWKKGITESIISGLRKALGEKKESGELPVLGEREKTKEEILRIETVQEFLLKLFDKLNLPQDQCNLETNQIHFLSGEMFAENFSQMDSGVGGFFRAGDSAIFMNDVISEGIEPAEAEMLKLSDLSHECIHSASHSKTLANVNPDHTISYGNYRTGYMIVDVGKSENKFKGFNEGVVCVTDRLMLSSESEELKKRFQLNDELLQKVGLNAYIENQILVHTISSRIAEYRNESPSKSMTRMVRGQFTGEMMHLRDLNHIYGEGSLDLLARYQSSKDMDINEKQDPLIIQYFQSVDEGERNELKKEILSFGN